MALFYEPFDYDFFGFPAATSTRRAPVHRGGSFSSPFELRAAPVRRPVYRRTPAAPVLSYPFFVDLSSYADEPDEEPEYHRYYEEQPVLIQNKKKKNQPDANKKPLELKIEEHGKKGWTASVELSGVRSTKDIDLEIKDDDSNTLLIRSSRGKKEVIATLQLPEGVDEEKIRALWSSGHGVLTIVMPRRAEVEQSQQQPQQSIEASKSETPSELNKTIPEKKPQHSGVVASPFLNLWKHLSAPRVSTTQTDTHIVTKMEFPEGIDKDHLDIEVNKGVLLVTACKKDEGSSFTFRRTLPIPKNVNQEDIRAKFEGSSLEISYPKPEPKKEKTSFKISISGSLTTTSPGTPSNSSGEPSSTLSNSSNNTSESTQETQQSQQPQVESPKAAKSEEVLIEDAVDEKEPSVATA